MARVTIDTREYKRSHAREPRGYGCWMFRNADAPGIEVSTAGTYTEARKMLAPGRWVVLP